MSVPDKLFFRIGEAADLVGVEPHVLRYWESEFKIRPQRSDSGQRLYRRNDIGRFLRIRKLLHGAPARRWSTPPTMAGPTPRGCPTRSSV
jgi:hypothetical protein